MRTIWIPVMLAAPLLLGGIAAAQFGGVSQCSQQCLPTDPDLNGSDLKTGTDPVQVVLYPHFDGIQRAPLNTQIPPDYALDENRGGSFLPAVAIPGGALNFRAERFVWWSTPGFACYLPEGRAEACHDEHGLADDIQIAGDTLTLYFYLSAHAVPNHNSNSMPVEAGVMPQMAVYARVETGRNPFNSKATLIAEGDTGKTDTTPVGDRVNVVSLPNTNEDVYEFKVTLDVKEHVIPFLHDELRGGYVVTIIPYQVRTDDWSAEATQADWRVRTGHKFLPRLIMPVEEVMKTTYYWANLFNDKLYLRWSLVSDFGSYDIDPLSISLDLAGPSGGVSRDSVFFDYLKYGVDHDAHFKPANQTWGIDYRKVPLADGTYVATGSAHNLQHTYLLTQTWTFEVKDGVPLVEGYVPPPGQAVVKQDPKSDSKDSSSLPGFELVGLVAAVVAVAAAVSRRR